MTLPLTPLTPSTLTLGPGIAVTGTRTAGSVPVVQSDLSVAWSNGPLADPVAKLYALANFK